LLPELQGTLRPSGHNFEIIDVDKLQTKLEHLALEVADFLDYVMNQPTSEKRYENGIRDEGRGAVTLEDFMKNSRAVECGLRYLHT
jgi:hypothetical protein